VKSIERRAREHAAGTGGGPDGGRGRGRNFMSERPLVWSFIATLGVLLGLALAWTLLSLSGVLFSVFAAMFITLGLDPATSLADAHAWASEVEERLRRARPDVADVIVHTEP